MYPSPGFQSKYAHGGTAIYAIFPKVIRKTLYAIMLAGMLFSISGAGNVYALRQAVSDGSRVSGDAPSSYPGAQASSAQAFRDFGVLSDSDGWILVGSQLYWTASSGV